MEKVTLFCLDKNKKIKEWSVSVTDEKDYALIKCNYGYIDGKKASSNTKIDVGKNIGKKNETSYLEQAILEAKSKLEKKKKEGYLDNIPDQSSDIEVYLPMLAQEYKKHKSKVKFPCLIQPKLDGYRMIYNPYDDTLRSRSGAEYEILINSNIHNTLRSMNLEYPVDGEVYVHKNLVFEDYGVLRKKKITTEDMEKISKLEYHIYDAVIENKDFNTRFNELKKLNFSNKVRLVCTVECKSEDDIFYHHENMVQEGYEGSMVRNKSGMYKCKFRSYDLLKLKDFDDAEFKIINYTFEKDTTAKDNNLVVWICATKEGKLFNVQSKGTREERQELYKNASKYIDNMLWVQYFGLTSDGLPRFPKTMRNGIESIRSKVM
jgi:ATP-dependent DNA ligase